MDITLSPVVWLALGILLMALEIVVPSFVLIWFGAGALLTAFCVLMGFLPSSALQWGVFFLSSAGFLFLWNFYLKGRFHRREQDKRDPTVSGLRGKAIERILPSTPGEVELYDNFHGLRRWKAESDEIIEVGEEIEVCEANGIKFIVKKVN